jgi:uncharacterized protein YjbI with pentapeptide repeats
MSLSPRESDQQENPVEEPTAWNKQADSPHKIFRAFQRRYKSEQVEWDTFLKESDKTSCKPFRVASLRGNIAASKFKKCVSKLLRMLWIETPKSEWIKLLAAPLTIPIALAIATSIITERLQRENTQNAALEKYFDYLEKLILEENLLADSPNPEATIMARARTITALHQLDSERQNQVINFLNASGMIKVGSTQIVDFSLVNLSETDLSEINLSHSDLSGINLKKSNLRNANLRGSNLSEANLSYANLEGANLRNTNLYSIDLSNTDLSSVYFYDEDGDGVNLSNADLRESDLRGVDFFGADLSGAQLQNSQIRDADLRHANLHGANFNGVNFSRAKFSNIETDFQLPIQVPYVGTNFNYADLSQADFRKTDLGDANFLDANLDGTIFYEADLSNAQYLSESQLLRSKLCRTKLPSDFNINPDKNCK